MTTDYTTEDYRETVESIAQEILEDKGLDSDNWGDRIHEEVDSNAYIIMYAGPPVVKEASDNFPSDMTEVTAMAGPDADFERLLAAAAFMAMEQDVREKCIELAGDAEECSRCDSAIFPGPNGEPNLYECEECGEEVCFDCVADEGGQLCKDCYEEDLEEVKPSEDDAILSDCGPLGSKTSLSLGRRFLGEFNTQEEAFIYLRTLAKYENVFPNVWYISDHGNPILQKDFDWDLK